MIPIVGGFITATAEATAEVTKLRLAFMQIQQEAFQDLAAAGLRLGGEQGLGEPRGALCSAVLCAAAVRC
jgi:hypothetical protein